MAPRRHSKAAALPKKSNGGDRRRGVASPTSVRSANVAVRRKHAVELRVLGGSFADIAATLRDQLQGTPVNYSAEDAWRDVMAELNRIREETAELVDNLRSMELLRLDEMWAAIFPFAKQGDVQAIMACLRIMDQRAKYLVGLQPLQNSKATAPAINVNVGTDPNAPAALPIIREIVVALQQAAPVAIPEAPVIEGETADAPR